jgi:hypothetical protein
MSRTYEQLLPLVEACSEATSEAFLAFRDRLRESATYLRTGTLIGTEAWRESREQGLADIYAQCGYGLGAPSSAATLAERLLPVDAAHHADIAERLRTILRRRFYGADLKLDPELDSVVDVLMDYFRQEQAIVRTAAEIQQRINALLGRTPPTRPLTASGIAIYYRLQDVGKRLPYLVDEIEETLGLRLAVSSDAIEVEDLWT